MEKERVVRLGRSDDGASRCYEDAFVVWRTVLDVDGLINDLARYEAGPLSDADAVLADVLQEEVGVVGKSECDSPGDVPVVADREGGEPRE